MTPLREAMIRAMQMRGFSERTHHSYLMAVTDLAHWTEHSPAELSPVQVNGYFEHLVIERGLAPASCRLFFHGIRFLYSTAAPRAWVDSPCGATIAPRRHRRIMPASIVTARAANAGRPRRGARSNAPRSCR